MVADTTRGMEASYTALVAHVRTAFSSYDGSHDFAHLERVVANARALAAASAAPPPAEALISVSALLHDIDDKKYGGDEVNQPRARAALRACGVSDGDAEKTCAVIRGVSFTTEMARMAAGGAAAAAGAEERDPLVALATAIVQDADRLDAIGATGIACVGPAARPRGPAPARLTATHMRARALSLPTQRRRCFCFGGSRNRPLAESVDHFHEKLLRLKGLMKTPAGRAAAEARHETMVAFLGVLEREWKGELGASLAGVGELE